MFRRWLYGTVETILFNAFLPADATSFLEKCANMSRSLVAPSTRANFSHKILSVVGGIIINRVYRIRDFKFVHSV